MIGCFDLVQYRCCTCACPLELIVQEKPLVDVNTFSGCMYVCMYVSISVKVYVLCAYIFVYTHTYIHTHIYFQGYRVYIVLCSYFIFPSFYRKSLSLSLYIYIYIERERERQDKNIWVSTIFPYRKSGIFHGAS